MNGGQYEVQFTRAAEKELHRLPVAARTRIVQAIRRLAVEPRPRGVKKLQREERAYRIRVGAYRVIYEIHDRDVTVLVIRVRHRKDAYN